MNSEFAISFGRQAITIATEVSAPILGAALITGLVISIFQAVTQLQEMTLAIIPKMLAVIITIVVLYPWILNKLTTFMANIFSNFPTYIGL